MITRTFKLCLNAGTGSAPYINVSQYDEGETWLFELYSETGERYIPTTGAIVGVKSDGHGIANTGTVDSDGRVVIAETQQMTASAGRAIYELSIDGLTHGTANFIVAVERKPTDDAVMSDSDLSLIQEAIDSAEVIVEVIGDGDPSEVIGEHIDEWLDAHPEATTTVLDGAITAPKINSTLWDKLLVSEEASGAVASFEDGADDVPVSSLKVALEPVQLGSGDPSPSNIRPIIAANGINIWDEEWELGTLDTSTGELTSTSSRIRSKYFIPVKPSTTYCYFQQNNTSSKTTGRACFYDENQTFISGSGSTQFPSGSYSFTNATTFTTPATAHYMKFSPSTAYGTTYNHDISINCPSTYTDYHPYQGIMVDVKGKNLVPSKESFTMNGITGTANADGSITLNGTATSSFDVTLTPSLFLTAGTYTKQLIGGEGLFTFRTRKDNVSGADVFGSGTGQKVVATLTEDTIVYCSVYIRAGDEVNNVTLRPVIYRGDVAEVEFEPYTSASYPYTLGQSVYGGTVDLATGVLTVTHFLYAYEGTETFRKSGTALNGFFNQVSTNTPHNWPKSRNYNGVSLLTNECSNMFMPTINSNTYKNNYGYVYFDSGHNFNCDPAVFGTTVDSFKAKLAELYANGTPVSVFCQIAEPQTIQLTPQEVKTLLGYNNISSSGTVDVIYHADTKLYVDKMTAVDNNIIAPTEADFVATRNYTVNDLVIVADTLYKVTANIASGSAITPNSNVQQTTLSALIKALS